MQGCSVTDLTVVKLTGLRYLPLASNRGVDAAQMRQGGRKGQPVQHLQTSTQLMRAKTLASTAFVQHICLSEM